MDKKKAFFEEKDILYVHVCEGDAIVFGWGIEKFGFGTTTFYYKDGKLMCNNETLDKEDIKKILCAFVDEAEFTE